MKKIKKKVICIGLVIIFILIASEAGISVDTGKTFGVRTEDGIVIAELTEKEAYELTETLLSFEDKEHLSADEKISYQMDKLVEYGIFPKNLTIDVINKILGRENKDSNANFLKTDFPRITPGKIFNNFAPHFILYVSAAGQAVSFHIGRNIPIAGDISRLVDILNITDPNTVKLMENITIFSYFHYTDCLILVAGPLGIYSSVGVIPSWNSVNFFTGPFFGVYLVYLGTGLYIYDKSDVEKPLLDIFFGFCGVLSIVQLLETVEEGD